MAVGLLRVIRRTVVTDAPVVSAMFGVAMALPQKFHPVIDDDVCAWPAHKMRNGERMHDPRRRKQIAGRRSSRAVAGRRGPPVVVEVVETAKRINNASLEEREEVFRLLK